MRSNVALFISVILLSSVGHLATDIYLASMPSMVDYFSTSISLVQLTLSVYLFSFCLVPLIMGPLSDRIGRKLPIMVGINIAMLATLGCMFATQIYVLIFARFIQGIGLGMAVSVSRAVLPDHLQGKELAKYYSYMVICMPLILSIGPPVGGIIQDFGSWRMVFAFLFCYLLGLLLITKYQIRSNENLVKDTLPHQDKDKNNLKYYIASYYELLNNRNYILYGSLGILTFMGITSFLSVSAFLFQEKAGLSPTSYGFSCFFMTAVTAISGVVNLKLIKKYKPRTILFIVIPFIMAAGLSLLIFNALNWITPYTLLFSFALFFVTVPISFSISGSMSLTRLRGNFGAATALTSTLQFFCGSLLSMLISYLNQSEMIIMGIIFLGIGLGYLSIAMIASEERAFLATR